MTMVMMTAKIVHNEAIEEPSREHNHEKIGLIGILGIKRS